MAFVSVSYGDPMGYPSPVKSSTRARKVGYPMIFACLALAFVAEASTGFLRKLCTTEVYFKYDDKEPYGIWSELYPAYAVDYAERAKNAPIPYVAPNTLAFAITMLECPELAHQGVKEDQPPSEMFYDLVSILKYSLCAECKVMDINGITYATNIYAVIPADAAQCMGPNGELFDRVKVLEDLRIGVKMLGSPVHRDQVSSAYLRDNVDKDVGIKDLMKLRIFNMTQHPVAVLVDYTTVIMQPLQKTIGDFLNSPAKIAYSEDYSPHGVVPSVTTTGVNTGFLMVKPSQQEFDNIVSTYKSTPYSPATGWGSSGIGNFPGAMGTSGILKYYYSQKPATEKTILNKCVYNNDAEYQLDGAGRCRDGTTNCARCQGFPGNQVVVGKINDRVCGKPFDCPDKGLPIAHKCNEIHKKWFTNRVNYENASFFGGRRAKRDGNFNAEVTLGFCKSQGSKGYQKLLPDNPNGGNHIPDPPALSQAGCPSTCGPGQFLTLDCTCVSDACAACPLGTRCQEGSNGVPTMCVDCRCGFCTFAEYNCCKYNGIDTCTAASPNKECLLENGYFPGVPGAGNVCGNSMKMSAASIYSGCGCTPSSSFPCTYQYDATPEYKDKCFVMTSKSLITTSDHFNPTCKACLDSCNACVSGAGQGDTNDMMECVGKTIGKDGPGAACRESCAKACVY